MKLLASTLISVALLGGCSAMSSHSMHPEMMAMASDMPTRSANGQLIGPNGNTLYVSAKDGNGMSNCYDKCAAMWPPLGVASTAMPVADYTIVTRTDGTKQWAYQGQPLYYFAKDQKSGEMMGDGMGGNWKTVRP